MALGAGTLFPYMNARDYPLATGNLLLVPYNGTITFKWGVEQAGTSKPTFHVITAEGRWGGQNASHFPIVAIKTTAPTGGIPFIDFATMQSNINNYTPESYAATNDAGVTYAVVAGTDYYALINGQIGKAWVPVRTRTAAGTAVISGVSCDLYTATLDVDDVPTYFGEVMSADEVFELCWSGNGRHRAYGWDAEFKLTPEGVKLHGDLFDRTELNSRVAGEKAIFEDELITLSQLEAGNGVSLKYRDASGALAGYTTTAAYGYNVVIEADGTVPTVEGQYEDSTVYYTSGQNDGKIAFRDRYILHVEPEDGLLPIKFEVSSGSQVSAYAYNNNLYVSRRNLGGFVFYPMDQAGYNVDSTVNHIRFEDTDTVYWVISGTRMPTQTPEGIIYRKGVVVKAERPLSVTNNYTVVGDDDVHVLDYIWSTDQWNVADPVPTIDNRYVIQDRTGGDATNSRREISSQTPAKHGIYTRHWYTDYVFGDTARTFGWNGVNVVPSIYVGINGFDTVAKTTDKVAYDDNYIRERQYSLQNLGPLQAWTLDVDLHFPGIYLVDICVEGIMGLSPNLQPLNRVVHFDLHLFLQGKDIGDRIPTSDLFDSLGSVNFRDYVPADAYQAPYFGAGGSPTSNYLTVWNSRPWSIRGQAIVRIAKGGQFGLIRPMLAYDPGTGENRFWFQVCTASTRIVKLAGYSDFWADNQSQTTDLYRASVENYANNWFTMNFF